MKSLKRDNAGFTLVELVATIAIFAIASTAIFGFLNIATRSYGKGNNEVELQYEAQLAANQLMNLIIDTKKGITYEYVTDSAARGTITSDAGIPAEAEITSKIITLYADDVAGTGKDVYYQVIWEKADKKVYLIEYDGDLTVDPHEWKADHDHADSDQKQFGLLSSYVEDFSLDLTNVDAGTVRLKLSFKRESEYNVNQNIALRNKVEVNKSVTDIYEGY